MSGRNIIILGVLIALLSTIASGTLFILGYRGLMDEKMIDMGPSVNLWKIAAVVATLIPVGLIVAVAGGIKAQVDVKNRANG